MKLVFAIVAFADAGSPRNLTMVGLRPAFMDPKDMGDRDWADAAGDLFFYVGDQMANRVYCKDHPSAMLCSCEISCEDQVYSQVVVELTQGDDSLNTVVSRDGSKNGYAPCNPSGTPEDYTYNCVRGDTLRVGQAVVEERYNKPKSKHDYDVWKYNASKLIGGLWWSTPKGGDCSASGADESQCTWKHLETVKVINASCANDNVAAAVRARVLAGCYEACPSGEDDAAWQCENDCFFSAVFGTDSQPGMSRDELLAPFTKSFDSDDPLDGGCPPRHPSSAALVI